MPLIQEEKDDIHVKYELTCQKGVWFSAKSGRQAERWPRSYPCWKSFQSTEHGWSFPVCYPQFLVMVRDNISYTLTQIDNAEQGNVSSNSLHKCQQSTSTTSLVICV